MNKKVIYFTWLALCMFSCLCRAQTVDEVCKKLSAAYAGATNFSTDLTVTSFQSREDKNGTLISEGIIRKTKGAYYYKYDNEELLEKKDFAIVVDHNEKSLTYFKQKVKKVKKEKISIPGYDSLFKIKPAETTNNSSSLIAGVQDGLIHVVFYTPDDDIRETHCWVDQKTYFLKRLVYIYADPTDEDDYGVYKLLIEYKNTTRQTPDPSYFLETKYLIMTKDGPQPLAIYKSYEFEIINNDDL